MQNTQIYRLIAAPKCAVHTVPLITKHASFPDGTAIAMCVMHP